MEMAQHHMNTIKLLIKTAYNGQGREKKKKEKKEMKEIHRQLCVFMHMFFYCNQKMFS
jgi:hypothetical protein